MEFKDLDAAEKAVIRAVQRIGGRWPKALRLISSGGGLSVAYNDGNSPDQLIAAVPGIPLGGEWQREQASRWWYEFGVRDRTDFLKQEIAVQMLLLSGPIKNRHRFTFDEKSWRDFRESAYRAGLSLTDIQRTPVLPAEDVV